MADFGPENTTLTSSLTANNIAVVNTSFNITCSTKANPPAAFRFYRDGMSLFNTATGMLQCMKLPSVREEVQ